MELCQSVPAPNDFGLLKTIPVPAAREDSFLKVAY